MNKKTSLIKDLIVIDLISILIIISFGFSPFSFAQLPQTPEEMEKLKIIPPETGTGPEAELKETPTPSITIYQSEVDIPFIMKKGEGLSSISLTQLIKKIMIAIFRISGILAFIIIIWGGIEYMTATGNAEKQKSAQQHITGAIIGLVLLFAFWLIINTINPDILRTNSSIIDGNGDGGGGNNGGQPNPSPKAKEIAQKLLDNGENFEISWTAAKKDLQDVIDNKCISIYNNSTPAYRENNCIKEEGTKDEATDTIHPYPDCLTIHEDLLVALDYLTNEKFEEIKNGLPSNCDQKLLISPFLSDHNYCTNPAGSHKYGCSTDITIDNDKNCTQQLLKLLCPGISNLNSCVNTYTCSISLGGVPIGIVNETNCAGTEPHLHFQAKNCSYP